MLTATDLFPEAYTEEGQLQSGDARKGEITPAMTETEIYGKGGSRISVLMETGRIEISGNEGYIVNVREISSRVTINKTELRRNRIISELQSSLLFLSEPAFEIAREIPLINYKLSIKKSFQAYEQQKIKFISG